MYPTYKSPADYHTYKVIRVEEPWVIDVQDTLLKFAFYSDLARYDEIWVDVDALLSANGWGEEEDLELFDYSPEMQWFITYLRDAYADGVWVIVFTLEF